jgi:hypothetical protein
VGGRLMLSSRHPLRAADRPMSPTYSYHRHTCSNPGTVRAMAVAVRAVVGENWHPVHHHGLGRRSGADFLTGERHARHGGIEKMIGKWSGVCAM